jgi:hypothetical protein
MVNKVTELGGFRREKLLTIEWIRLIFNRLKKGKIIKDNFDFEKFLSDNDINLGINELFKAVRHYYNGINQQEFAQLVIENEKIKSEQFNKIMME